MKLTIFGSTGGLGSECLRQALEQGHPVTVLVRNPDKLPGDVRKEKYRLDYNKFSGLSKISFADCRESE